MDLQAEMPRISLLGLSGVLVTFSDDLSEPANRAALAFRAAIDAKEWRGVEETATSLTSVFVRFDPLRCSSEELTAELVLLVGSRDWLAEDLPAGRRLWTIPCAFGGTCGPQLDEAADLAGVSAQVAIDQICATRTRVMTIGFLPGQPYLGSLPANWDFPRQTAITPTVPQGALVTAIRQLIIFAGASQTGWRHIGLTAFRCFRPEAEQVFPLTPGDEICFAATSEAALDRVTDDPNGGATCEVQT